MSASPEFVEYVKELFTPLGGLEEGKFFGGFAFKYGSKQFAMIMGNTLYFCVNDETRPKFIESGMVPFSYSTKRGLINVRKYYTVPENLFDENDEFLLWAQEAIDVAHST